MNRVASVHCGYPGSPVAPVRIAISAAHLAEFSHGADADDKVIGRGASKSVLAGARVAEELFAFHAAMRRPATKSLPLLLHLLPPTLLLTLLLLLVVVMVA